MLAEFKSRDGWKQEKAIERLDEYHVFAFMAPLKWEAVKSSNEYFKEMPVHKLYFKLVDYWKNSKGEVIKAFYEEM